MQIRKKNLTGRVGGRGRTFTLLKIELLLSPYPTTSQQTIWKTT